MNHRIKIYRIADYQWSIRRTEAFDHPSTSICAGWYCCHIYRKPRRTR